MVYFSQNRGVTRWKKRQRLLKEIRIRTLRIRFGFTRQESALNITWALLEKCFGSIQRQQVECSKNLYIILHVLNLIAACI